MDKDKITTGLCLGLSTAIIGGIFIFVGINSAIKKQEAKAYEQSYAIIQELIDKKETITEIDDIFEFVEAADQIKTKVNKLIKPYNSRAKEHVEERLFDVQQAAVNKSLYIAFDNTLESSNFLKLGSSGVEKYGDGYSWTKTEIKAKEGNKDYYSVYESISDKKFYQAASKPATAFIAQTGTPIRFDTQTITSEGELYGRYTNTMSYKTNIYNFLPDFVVDDTETISLSNENETLTISTTCPIDRGSPNLQRQTFSFTIDENNCLTNYFVSNCSRDCSYTFTNLDEDEFNHLKEIMLEKYDTIEASNSQQQ